MRSLPYMLSLYILMKPFYFWSSGLPQISDIFLFFVFLLFVLLSDKSSIVKVFKENWYYFAFLFFVVIINTLFSIFYYDASFLLHSLYYIFDGLGILLFAACFRLNNRSGVVFKRSFEACLLVQLLIYFLRLGRYYGAFRYMGTFNDPNQFAYFVFLSFSFIYLLSWKKKEWSSVLFFVVSIFLIIESGSTGMLVGMVTFLVFYLVILFRYIIKNIKKYLFPIFASLIVLCIGVSVAISVVDFDDLGSNITDISIISRVKQKLNRANGKSDMSLWQERGYDRMVYYPEYILFGAGEGNNSRFEKAYHQGEFHSTLPSILFSYGVFPFSLIIIWFYKKIKSTNFEIFCIYFALLLESFTLLNSRQVLFWVIFLLCPFVSDIASKEERDIVNNDKNVLRGYYV